MEVPTIRRSDLDFGEELGTGGFSTVYRAMWMRSPLESFQVAAKKMNKLQDSELEIMSKLNNENIVRMLGVVNENPDFFLVLELCAGGSLRAYLDILNASRQRLPEGQFYCWAKQAGKPIEYLKNNGIIHKDVKSENYVISDQNILKLTDFGLSKEIHTTITHATGSATITHMAPELLREFILSPSYDIFSYGVVIWELWKTDIPFEGLERNHIIWKVCQGETLPISDDCAKPIADLMRQCWLTDWKKRPSIDQVLAIITEHAEVAKASRQRLLLNGPWVSEQKIGTETGSGKLTSPCGMAVNRNGDFAVASYDEQCVKVYSDQGNHKFNLSSESCALVRPCDVVASCNGSLYFVTDHSQYLKVFDNAGQLKDKWAVVSPQGKPSDTEDSEICGLEIDANNQVLVGELKQMYISKHRLDGSHIGSINVSIKPMTIAATSQDAIVVGEWLNSPSVHILSNSGCVLCIVRIPAEFTPIWNPCEIACIDDIICICDRQTGKIQCFSLSGQYIGFIPIDIQDYPGCLTFSPDGTKLLVTLPFRVELFKLQAETAST